MPPRLRGQPARRIQEEERAAAQTAARAESDDVRARRRSAVVAELASIHAEMLDAGLSYAAADQSVAALAPLVWRTTPK